MVARIQSNVELRDIQLASDCHGVDIISTGTQQRQFHQGAFPIAGAVNICILYKNSSQALPMMQRLTKMGHQVTQFSDAASLLSAIERGLSCDLVMLSVDDQVVRRSLYAAFKMLNIPVMVMVCFDDWKACVLDTTFFQRQPAHFVADRICDEELQWRIWSCLSPFHDDNAQTISPVNIWGDYEFINAANIVVHKGVEVTLQPKQFNLAFQLFTHAGHILAREWLAREIWKQPFQEGMSRTLDTCAANVRKKLSLNARNGFVLRAIYGQGYRLSAVAQSLTLKKRNARSSESSPALEKFSSCIE